MHTEQAFTNIIKENEGIIYKVTRLYTSNKDDQKDLYQEVVYNLWKGFKTFRGDAKVSTWMYRIALNTAVFYSKKKKKMFGLNVYFRSNLELECDDVSRDSVRLSQATGQHARCVNCAKAFGHVHLLVDLHLNAVCFSCLH